MTSRNLTLGGRDKSKVRAGGRRAAPGSRPRGQVGQGRGPRGLHGRRTEVPPAPAAPGLPRGTHSPWRRLLGSGSGSSSGSATLRPRLRRRPSRSGAPRLAERHVSASALAAASASASCHALQPRAPPTPRPQLPACSGAARPVGGRAGEAGRGGAGGARGTPGRGSAPAQTEPSAGRGS